MIVRLDTRNLFDPLLGKGLGVGYGVLILGTLGDDIDGLV